MNACHDGRKPTTSIEALLLAFEPLLAPEVISQICKILDALKHSILGVEIVFLPNLNSILEYIVLDFKERAYAPLPLPTINHNDGWQHVPLQRQGNMERGN